MNGFFYIEGFAEWHEADGEKTPDVGFIPAMIRRRLTDVEKTGLYLADKVCPARGDFYTVFASRFGEWGQTVKLIKQFYADKEMSPAGFASSVHNATPGILSVIKHNTMSYITVAAGERTIGEAITEAFIGPKPVLFIYAEERTPDLYRSVFPNPFGGHGAAFLLNDKDTGGRKIKVETCFNDSHVCSFRDLTAFLVDGAELVTEHFKIRNG